MKKTELISMYPTLLTGLTSRQHLAEGPDYNWIFGTDGDDELYGEERNDFIDGGAGHDELYGGAGYDMLWGGAGRDTIYGGDDDDSLFGGTEQDYLNGEDGNDYLNGEDGDDSLKGGDGDDNLNGGDGNDTLRGGNDDDVLSGNGGVNYLYGDSGYDTVYGGIGTDIIDGGSSTNTVNYSLSTSGVIVNLQQGKGFGGWAEGDTYKNITTVIGSNYDDIIYGLKSDNYIYSVQNLKGGGGNDTIYAAQDKHECYLEGGSGADTLFGNEAANVFVVSDDMDTLYDQTSGDHDHVLTTSDFTLTAGQYLEELSVDTIANKGKSYRLTGNEKANQVEGGYFNDTIRGGDGNDTLIGSDGNDELTGDAGADIFKVRNATYVDTFTDFAHKIDKISLSMRGFLELERDSKGILRAEQFRKGPNAIEADDRIIYDDTTGALYYDKDGSGSVAAVKFGILSNMPSNVSYSDFTVY